MECKNEVNKLFIWFFDFGKGLSYYGFRLNVNGFSWLIYVKNEGKKGVCCDEL